MILRSARSPAQPAEGAAFKGAVLTVVVMSRALQKSQDIFLRHSSF
jgi:hypothetical protein